MTDNTTLNAGTGGDVIADEDISGVKYQRIKIVDGRTGNTTNKLAVFAEDDPSGNGDTGIVALVKRADTPAATSGTDGDYEPLQVSGGKLWVTPLGLPKTIKVDVTRQAADTTQYTAGDCISDSTSAPTSGGFTITNAARVSGGSCLITDVCVATSADASTKLAGEIWLFDTSVTNINDNNAFVVSDSEIKTCVGLIPFSLFDAGNNGYAHITGLNILATCSGSANLRFLLRARNAYTPVGSEVLSFAFKLLQID